MQHFTDLFNSLDLVLVDSLLGEVDERFDPEGALPLLESVTSS